MSFGGDSTDCPQQPAFRKDSQKAESDERRRLQAAGNIIVITQIDKVVKTRDFLMSLGTDAAHQPVAKGWHLSQGNNRPVFQPSIRLR